MKLIISIIVFALFAASMPAMATTSTKVTTKKNTFNPEKLKGLSFLATYSFTDRLPIKAGTDMWSAESETAFGFGAQYEWNMRPSTKGQLPANVIAGLLYETPRELKSIKIGGQNITPLGSKPSFSMIMAYGNVDMDIADQASFFAGLNYPIPFESDFGDTTLSGQLGYQIGLTLDVAQNFSADVFHRWVNLEGNNGLNRMDVDGLQIQGRYVF